MRIISIMPGHNSTVGLFEDGECKSIFQEEKFTNIKNHLGFPKEALNHLHKLLGSFDGVDYFVFPFKQQIPVNSPLSTPAANKKAGARSAFRDLYREIEYRTGLKDLFFAVRDFKLYNMVTPKVSGEIAAWLKQTYGVDKQKIRYFDHHLCHCITPLYFFNLEQLEEETLLISVDGEGDNSFAKIFIYDPRSRSLKQIANSRSDASIGLIYAEMTRYLGMKPNEHEYKVMGLAAYVSEEKYFKHIYDRLSEIVWLDKDKTRFESRFNTNVSGLYFRDRLCFERFDNVSAALQKLTEDLILSYIKLAIQKTGIQTIACSGGVFMNVKMNQKIANLPEVKKVYFQPSCGDESLVIGGACKMFMDGNVRLKRIGTMYLGHTYSNDDVKRFLESKGCFEKYTVKYFDDIEKETARLMSKFEIVARFKGAGEWGARSLCNRAILGNATDLRTFYEVNDMIKMRDFWMPFAPTIQEEWAEDYIKDWRRLSPKLKESSKYMIITFDSTELAHNHLRAAMHQKDKTLRPQIIAKEDNPDLHRLMKHYEKLTGMGGCMNTSLNMHGYPLVGTLEQSLFTFENSGLKCMTLENYLIKK